MSQVGFLKNKVLYSPLANQSTLRPQRQKTSRNAGATLMLTSLVDAFSILVIFLMMNSAAENSDFQVDKKVVLPKSSVAQTTMKTAVVKLSEGKIYINDQITKREDLGRALGDLQKTIKEAGHTTADSLVIIADQDMDFATLNPIIVAGSRVGFSEFKFAVQKVEGQSRQ